jgi:hypothetical protein
MPEQDRISRSSLYTRVSWDGKSDCKPGKGNEDVLGNAHRVQDEEDERDDHSRIIHARVNKLRITARDSPSKVSAILFCSNCAAGSGVQCFPKRVSH